MLERILKRVHGIKTKEISEANAQRENPFSLILSLGFGESQFVVDNNDFQRILINSNCDKVDVEADTDKFILRQGGCGNEKRSCYLDICVWICRLQFETEVDESEATRTLQ